MSTSSMSSSTSYNFCAASSSVSSGSFRSESHEYTSKEEQAFFDRALKSLRDRVCFACQEKINDNNYVGVPYPVNGTGSSVAFAHNRCEEGAKGILNDKGNVLCQKLLVKVMQ